MSLFERLQFYLSSIGTGKKLGIFAILLIAVSLPLTLIVSQQQQDVRQRASSSDFPTGFWNANLTLSWSNKTTNEIGFSNDDGSICFIFKANDGTWNGPKACSSDLAPWKGNVSLIWSNPVNGDLAFCNNSSLSDCWLYNGTSYNHKGALSITPPWKNYSGSIFTWTNYNANQMAFCTNSGNPCWIWDSSSANFNPRDMSGSAPFGSFSADERILSWSNPKSNEVAVCNNTGTKCFFWSASGGWRGPVNKIETGSTEKDTVCTQQITYAKNPSTNQCQEFNSSCEVPSGWTNCGGGTLGIPTGSIRSSATIGDLNTDFVFTADINSNEGTLAEGSIYAARKEGSSAVPINAQGDWCEAAKIAGANKEWCTLKEQAFSGTSQSFSNDPFKFKRPGTYVVVVNVKNQGNINCSGNPFSLLPNWTTCGSNSKIEITINNSSPKGSISVPPSSGLNTPLVFNATADGNGGILDRGEIYVAKKQGSSPASTQTWCPEDKRKGVNKEWCLLKSQVLSGASQSFQSDAFAFSTAGTYVAVVNIRNQGDINCSGNPFSLLPGWTDCGENSKKEIIIGTRSVTASITASPSTPISINGTVNFEVDADSGGGSFMKGQIWIANKDGSDVSAWCPSTQTTEDKKWCKIVETALSGSRQTFNGSFTFTQAGNYYAATNVYNQNNAGRCSGNPFGFDSTWTSCGPNSKVEVRVNPNIDPSITTYPSITNAANGNVRLNLAVALQGIGAFNPNPKTQQRQFIVELFTGASETTPVKRETENLIYNSQTKLFEGVINLQNISTNSYVVKIKTKKYLRKRWEPPLLVDATRETVKTVSGVTLLAGDIKDDTETDYNELNINDYNLYISCFGKTISDSIGSISCANADLNDDGLLDNRQSQRDYSLLLESFRVRKGD